MKIDVEMDCAGTPQVEVPNYELLKAYDKGGLEAVNEMVQELADLLPETPFWIANKVTEADIQQLKEQV